MTNEVSSLQVPAGLRFGADFGERLEAILDVFRAIDAGELLSALPNCPIASQIHLAALSLLSTAELELLSIAQELGCALP
ncbi:MAG: hypothetical protein ACK5T5_12875 [Phenylobacterium sp.]